MTERTNRPGRRQRVAALLASFGVLAAILMIAPASASAGTGVELDWYTSPPSTAAVGDQFTVRVGLFYISGGDPNPVTGISDNVTLSITKTSSGTGNISCSAGTYAPINTYTGVASFGLCQFDTSGTYLIHATSSDGTIPNAPDWAITITNTIGLNHLVFNQQPSGGAVNAAWGTQPRIAVLDQYGALSTANDGSQVALSIASGPSFGLLSCTGGNTSTVNGGYAYFTGCRIDVAGTYTLTANSLLLGGPTSATSSSFVVGTSLPDHLRFTTSPGNMASGANLSPSPVVQVVDASNNPVGGAYAVSLSLTAVNGSGNLACPLIQVWTDSVTGAATFTGCSVTGSGTFFLQATAAGLPSGGSSQSFTVGGSSNQVVFQTQPLGANIGGSTATGQAGVAWSTQPVVALKDQFNNTATADNSSRVRLTITSGTPTSGGPGVLSCTANEVTVVAGLAYFQGCSINTAGTGYQITATVVSSPLGIVPVGSARTSLAFNISAVSQLAFTQQPLGAYTGNIPNGSAGTAWATQPIVSVRTPTGTVITSDNTTVVGLSITPGTPLTGTGGILSCTGGNQKTVVSGSASFAGCSISATGTQYQIRATVISSTTVPVGTYVDSLPFSLTMAAATINLTTYPSVVIWGDPFTATIQFTGGGNHAYVLQRLAQTDNGVWQNVVNGTTDTTGRAVVQYTPRFNGQYRVQFNGDSTLGAGTSNIRTVNVRNLVLLRPEWSGVKTVSVGYTQTYTATVRPVPSGGLPGGVSRVEFMFYQLRSGQWVKVKSIVVPLNSSGVGSVRYTWNSSGSWYIRARTLANPYNFVGTSDLQRVNVN